MSFGIVRVQKMSAGSVKGIEIHDRREKEGVSHTNKDIDWTRTSHNYDLHPTQAQNFNRAVKERISQLNLSKAVRKDAVVMAQCLVTSDHGFFENLSPAQTKQFFQESYEFLANRYGRENIVSSTVHMDERTPHMHFNFVPVTADGRLSAKTILNRTDLIKQQDEFFREVGQRYGLNRGERGGVKKHLEVAEYKVKTKKDEVQKLEQQINTLLRDLRGANSAVRLVQDIEAIPVKKSLLGGKIEMSEDAYNKLKETAKAAGVLGVEYAKYKTEVEKLRPQVESTIKLNIENGQLKSKIRTLEKALTESNGKIDAVNKALERLPEPIKDAFLKAYQSIQEVKIKHIHDMGR